MRFAWVFLGGGIGSVARYLVAQAWLRMAPESNLPAGTLAVNLIGSFFIALCFSWVLAGHRATADLGAFLVAGVLGGFTTYSSFNMEVVSLAQGSKLGLAAGYLGATMVGCLVAGAFGIWLGHALAR
jgi:CrcB protein